MVRSRTIQELLQCISGPASARYTWRAWRWGSKLHKSENRRENGVLAQVIGLQLRGGLEGWNDPAMVRNEHEVVDLSIIAMRLRPTAIRS